LLSKTIRGRSRILVWEWHWQGVWGTEDPQRGSGAEPRWRPGGFLHQKPKECYVMRLKKHFTKKNKSTQTDYDILYNNIIINLIS